ncbi:MAG: S41 family peptidase [Erysipelotrichia bacterium]|nr:S41 family peptidase [Erysipelotrichia bacterium]
MKKSFLRNTLIILFVILSAFFCFGSGYFVASLSRSNGTNSASGQFSVLESVYDYMLNDFYYGQSNDEYSEKLINDAIKGMVNAQGDIHTEYMTADELASFTGSLESSFVGIGVTYQEVDGKIFITDVIRSSPAEKSGVIAGDIITAIDGTELNADNIAEMADTIKGKVGTVVTVTILRGNKTFDLDITRDTISNTVFSEAKDNGVGILSITSFSDGTGEELENHLRYLQENNVTKLIIDLRDNTGGYASTLNTISSYFMEKGAVIMREYDRNGKEYVDYAQGGNKYHYDKIVILTNDYSASCSEVFTMAMKENCGAVTVGETTYGKGVAQITKMFRDGSALKYTDLIWKSGNNVFIGGKGIEPDYPVRLHEALYLSHLVLQDDESYGYDSVSQYVANMQIMLDFLGYDVDRQDGYFTLQTQQALMQFETAEGLTVDGILDKEDAGALNSAVIRYWTVEHDKLDTQMQKALELMN